MTDVPRRADGDGVERRTFLGVGGAVALGPVGRVLRSDAGSSSSPRETAVAYVSALDAGDRRRANELIADDGELDPWSEREFEWVPAFDIGLARFEPVDRRDGRVVADLAVTVDGNESVVRYEFRWLGPTGWRVYEAPDGLRVRT